MKYKIKWFFQKLFRGYSDIEIWNLNTTIAKWIIPRLKVYKSTTRGYPSSVSSEEEWDQVLGDIISGFEYYLNREDFLDENTKGFAEMGEKEKQETLDKIHKEDDNSIKNMSLLAKHFFDLWD